MFETRIASFASKALITLEDGHLRYDEESPVPIAPDAFKEELKSLEFNAQGTDREKVADIYYKVFPEFARHDSLWVRSWGDDQVKQLLNVLPQLKGLKHVSIWNGTAAFVSAKAYRKLEKALIKRDGSLEVHGGAVTRTLQRFGFAGLCSGEAEQEIESDESESHGS